jgi:hypothetical protein
LQRTLLGLDSSRRRPVAGTEHHAGARPAAPRAVGYRCSSTFQCSQTTTGGYQFDQLLLDDAPQEGCVNVSDLRPELSGLAYVGAGVAASELALERHERRRALRF